MFLIKIKCVPQETSSNIHMPCQKSLSSSVAFCNQSSFSIPITSNLHLCEGPLFFSPLRTLNHHCVYNFKAILAISCMFIPIDIVYQSLVQNWYFRLFSIFGNLFYNLPPILDISQRLFQLEVSPTAPKYLKESTWKVTKYLQSRVCTKSYSFLCQHILFRAHALSKMERGSKRRRLLQDGCSQQWPHTVKTCQLTSTNKSLDTS